MVEHDVIILTLEEVKEALTQFYCSVLVSDPKNTYEVIKGGELDRFIPNVKIMQFDEATQRYRELDLGGDLLELYPDADMIFAQDENYAKLDFLVERK